MKQKIPITWRDTGERPVPIRKPRDPRFDSVYPSRSNWELHMTREENSKSMHKGGTQCMFCGYIIVHSDWQNNQCMLCRNTLTGDNWAYKMREAWGGAA